LIGHLFDVDGVFDGIFLLAFIVARRDACSNEEPPSPASYEASLIG
jgi:hypothetical protein